MSLVAWVVFSAAAIFEVLGNAVIRIGLGKKSSWVVGAGMAALGLYGLIVNKVKWDFSKLLGVYVAFFAVVSSVAARFIFQEATPRSTWVGLGLIVAGGVVIEFGRS